MTQSRENFSLLLATIAFAGLLNACGQAAPQKPDPPVSVSPGWKLDALAATPKPADLPGSPDCWKASYSGQGTAEALICGYTGAGAFEAAQRARAEGQAVKFDQGKYFVMVHWNNSPKTAVTALVRAIQKSLH